MIYEIPKAALAVSMFASKPEEDDQGHPVRPELTYLRIEIGGNKPSRAVATDGAIMGCYEWQEPDGWGKERRELYFLAAPIQKMLGSKEPLCLSLDDDKAITIISGSVEIHSSSVDGYPDYERLFESLRPDAPEKTILDVKYLALLKRYVATAKIPGRLQLTFHGPKEPILINGECGDNNLRILLMPMRA